MNQNRRTPEPSRERAICSASRRDAVVADVDQLDDVGGDLRDAVARRDRRRLPSRGTAARRRDDRGADRPVGACVLGDADQLQRRRRRRQRHRRRRRRRSRPRHRRRRAPRGARNANRLRPADAARRSAAGARAGARFRWRARRRARRSARLGAIDDRRIARGFDVAAPASHAASAAAADNDRRRPLQVHRLSPAIVARVDSSGACAIIRRAPCIDWFKSRFRFLRSPSSPSSPPDTLRRGSPAKPLADIDGRPMIEHVYRRARRVAGWSRRSSSRPTICASRRACSEFGGNVRLTRADHATGTDRLAEVAATLDCDVVVNVQGDEPLIDPRRHRRSWSRRSRRSVGRR